MKAYCSSFYVAVLWDLTNASVQDVCIVWHKVTAALKFCKTCVAMKFVDDDDDDDMVMTRNKSKLRPEV